MSAPELTIDQSGSAGHIRLNRPCPLNALTLGMVRGIRDALAAWQTDQSIQTVVVTGEGDRAFCAGGDVKATYRAGKAGEVGHGLTADFFRDEYTLNHQIATYPKPYVAWLDGITMGGGVGISILGSHRIASEHLRFGMPETAIGFFPDVGGSYFMSRLGPLGTYLALTGAQFDAAACLKVGVATDYVPREAGLKLVECIGRDGLDAALEQLSEPPPPSESIANLQAFATECFSSFNVDDILSSLDAAESNGFAELAREARATLMNRSPTSVKVTLEQLRRGTSQSLKDSLIMEYRMSQACVAGHDFYEGIRAVLVDKDHSPKWSPATFDEVDNTLVRKHFAELGDRDLRL